MQTRLALALALIACLSASAAWWQARFDRRTEAALAQLKQSEPSIQEAQTAALNFFNVDPDTLSSMRTRAAWKNLLPSLSVRYRQGTDDADVQVRDLQTVGDEVAQRTNALADAQEFQVSGSWNLPKLMFNPEVLDVSSVAVLQEGVIKNVTRLYYTRRRLQVDLILNPPADAATRLSKSLRIEELTATLDALTGNLFTKRQRAAAARGGMGGMDDMGGAPPSTDPFIAR